MHRQGSPRRGWKSRLAGWLVGVAVSTLACQSAPNEIALDDASESWRFELRLPPRCEAWRPRLRSELQRLEASYAQVAARWPVEVSGQSPAALPEMFAGQYRAIARADPLRLVVTRDVEAARFISQRMELEGDARVPRTHPRARLALIALPRNDALVLERGEPPRSWLETFRHEAAHLLSLDRPGLRLAPLWFQEGFAELWADAGAQLAIDAWGSPATGASELLRWKQGGRLSMHSPLLDQLDNMPNEARLAAWRAIVALVLDRDPTDPRPWERGMEITAEEALTALEASGASARLRVFGRDFSPPGEAEGMLLASYPFEMVFAEWLAAWSGTVELSFALEVGRSGFPEAGMLIESASGERVRLRFGRRGGFAAYRESKDEVRLQPFSDRPTLDRGAIRHGLSLQIRNQELRIRSTQSEQSFDLEEGGLRPPFRLEFYVRDGVMKVQPDPATLALFLEPETEPSDGHASR